MTYYPRRTLPALARQYFKYGRGRAMTVARHKSHRRARQVIPLAIAPICAMLPLGLLFWPAALPALAWLALCLGAGAALMRPGQWCAAAAGIAAITMQAAWSFGYWKHLLAGPKPGAPPGPIPLDGR